MASITSHLSEPPQATTQSTIVKRFWSSPHVDETLKAYCAFYGKRCDDALDDAEGRMHVRSHADILDIVDHLKAGKSRREIKDVLSRNSTEQHRNQLDVSDDFIDLAANLLLMIDFTDHPTKFSGRQRLEWGDGSLSARLMDWFGKPPTLDLERTKLPRLFNAKSLRDIAGVCVEPTDNLADHLRLTHDDARLLLFHHVSCLKLQSESESLVQESRDTLSLLFPAGKSGKIKWYNPTNNEVSLDPRILRCVRLKTDDRRIERFQHWRDRLVVLKQVFDEATPQTISQYWHDSRNGVQWHTFWAAILVLMMTFVFGTIQIVLSGLQLGATRRDVKRV